jgi:hypothetical protein
MSIIFNSTNSDLSGKVKEQAVLLNKNSLLFLCLNLNFHTGFEFHAKAVCKDGDSFYQLPDQGFVKKCNHGRLRLDEFL